RVEGGVGFLLPAAPIEMLAEVAVAEEQPDGREGDAEVRGGLRVVAREDAEAAGIDGEALVEPVLHAEVARARSAGEAAGGVEVVPERVVGRIHIGGEAFVLEGRRV